MMSAIILTEKYVIKEVVRRGNSANVRFLEKEIGNCYSLIPLSEHKRVDIKKIGDKYKINVYNIDNVFTDRVKPIKSGKKVTGGYIGLNSTYVGINVLIIPYGIK